VKHGIEGYDSVGIRQHPDGGVTLGGDVLGEQVGAADGADGDEVDADDERSH
jgi:hypothetical protein